jgi:EpsI family protein
MNDSRHSWVRLVFVAVLLLSTAAFLSARNRPEPQPPRDALTSFPPIVGDRFGRDVTIPPDTLKVLGDGEFLERNFSGGTQPPIDLFIGYFPTQRTGSTMHSPQNCLPGAGWSPIESGRISVPEPDGPMTVNRYVVEKGSNRALVFYWYQSHGRVIASEYWAKFYLVRDSIRMHRSDGALVRVITPIVNGEGEMAAQRRAIAFINDLVPMLGAYIPR